MEGTKKMTVAEEKLAKSRLSLLELAKALGNISEACRSHDICRSQFYEYKRRFQTHGLQGLVDLPPIHKTHPQTTPAEVVEKLIAMSLDHPAWGPLRLSQMLKLEGISVSGPTIFKILDKRGMRTKYDRLLKLEEKMQNEHIELTAEQIKAIEKANPCFRERHVESGRPGELLCQDTFYVGTLKGWGKIFMQTVVDTYGSYGFARLFVGKLPEQAAFIIHNDVLPQYADWQIPVGSILTDNGGEYCGKEHSHPYELLLSLNDIEHRRTRVKTPRTNGFVERFNRTVLDEFLRTAFRTKFYASLDDLQAELDSWLHHYNFERPHQGYRNLGKRPFDTVKQFVKSVGKEG